MTPLRSLDEAQSTRGGPPSGSTDATPSATGEVEEPTELLLRASSGIAVLALVAAPLNLLLRPLEPAEFMASVNVIVAAFLLAVGHLVRTDRLRTETARGALAFLAVAYMSATSVGARGGIPATSTVFTIFALSGIGLRVGLAALTSTLCASIWIGVEFASHRAVAEFDAFLLVCSCVVAIIASVSRRSSQRLLDERTRAAEQALAIGRAREEALRLARDEAQVAARSRKEFLTTMSHELRTPLNGVLGMTTLLAGSELDARQREMIQHIVAAGEHLLSIIDDILDLSKLDSGRVELDLTDVELRPLLEELATVVAARDPASRVLVVLDVQRDVPRTIQADAVRLRQVLLNLLGNALKFTREGRVTLGARRREGCVELFVEDTGIGIAQEVLARLFEPFQQGDPSISRRFGGTGLGLTISQRLVTAMGGRIEVESEPGRGARFHFCLKAGEEESTRVVPPMLHGLPATVLETVRSLATPSRPAGSPPSRPPPSRAGRRLDVLVADDNPTNRLVASGFLESLGHRCRTVVGGAEAIEAYRQDPKSAELILMDIEMPMVNGLEAIRAIRGIERDRGLSRVPIVAVSAHAFAEHEAAALDAGADAYVRKPLRIAQLSPLLARLVPGAVAAEEPEPEPTHPTNEGAEPWVSPETLARLAKLASRTNPGFMHDLARAFDDSSASYAQAMSLALGARDADAIRRAAHALKGAARSIGANGLAEALQRLEHSPDPFDATTTLAEIDAAIPLVSVELWTAAQEVR